jgi:hypothetical protein
MKGLSYKVSEIAQGKAVGFKNIPSFNNIRVSSQESVAGRFLPPIVIY